MGDEGSCPRVLVAPLPLASDDNQQRMIQLRHPKTGVSTCYILVNNLLLHELNWFKHSCYSSWFLQDFISQDGGLYAATPLDPVFILLPLFHQARLKGDDGPGMFRPLDDILFIPDYPAYQFLSNIALTSMELLSDSKQIGSTKFFRLNDSKVLAWLYCKVQQLKETLVKLDNNYAAQTQKDTLLDVVMILGEYLADHQPWLKLLCNNLGLNIGDLLQAPDTKIHLPTAPKIDSSFNPTQDQSGRVTQNGKPNKKAKVVEKNSQNIKDMFTRASRRKR